MRKPTDILLLYAARATRGFGDGFAIIILPAYLSELGFGPFQIGIVASAALLGTAAITLAIGFLTPGRDLRSILLVGAFATVATGIAVPATEQLAFILLIAFVGTMNPSSGDIGLFVPLEHAMLAREAPDHDRTRIFAHYSLIGGLSSAAGALAAAVPTALVSVGVSNIGALKAMFYFYAALGLVAAAIYRYLPHAQPHEAASRPAALGPSKGIVYKLAALFSLDAFAGGFAVQSLVALWLFERFGLSLTAASLFFFWSNVLAAFSYPVAARLSKSFGLVNTMVFTHIPSSLCLILAAFSTNLLVVLGLLLLRSALSQMDVPTRTSYVMAVVTPPERPAAASVTAVPRSLASSLSPALAGALLTTSFTGLPLVVCGVLKITYDLSLLYAFRHTKPPEERVSGQFSR
ncbi:MAG: MFS transporter [Bradyrhizobium sp.]|uniref:MFS transporter n=1 Tax=Bradyrhizobium sp. TaxID=376 RepID=UPI00120DCA62|nr:MFS transporter [Bradyrhizobium sp.]THD52182.1 MAG: MFS transporter [Bradyrhizobium sp.]